MKKFNVTGVCIPEEHYMVDISKKIEKIEEMVDEGAYFTINRPRQYGKTTTMFLLSRKLSKRYIIIDTSFEGIGDAIFQTEKSFCQEIFDIFADSVEFEDEELAAKLRSSGKGIENFKSLSRAITKFTKAVKGLKQLSEYLEIQGLETGYMLVFNFNKNKEYKAEWLKIGSKDIFEITV